jgi:transaldolase
MVKIKTGLETQIGIASEKVSIELETNSTLGNELVTIANDMFQHMYDFVESRTE